MVGAISFDDVWREKLTAGAIDFIQLCDMLVRDLSLCFQIGRIIHRYYK